MFDNLEHDHESQGREFKQFGGSQTKIWQVFKNMLIKSDRRLTISHL